MRRVRGGIRLAIALMLALGAPLGAQNPGTTFARVTYISGSSVYVDAGERNGLAEGALLDVLRGGAVVAQLRARYLSPGRAQCDLVSGSPPAVGDSVRYTRTARVTADRDTAPAVRPAVVARRARAAGASPSLRGRIGIRYLAALERDSGSARLAQPAADARLDGSLPGMPWIDVALDARARRTSSVSIDGVVAPSRTTTLVYQSSLTWNFPAGAHLRIGRQYSGELASVSLFDGALLGLERNHFGAGVFAGSQPDAATMGYSTRVREYGAYVAARAAPRAGQTVALTGGAITSYDGPNVDREFAFVTAAWYGGPASIYTTQEIDYNRGWKEVFGKPMISPTSTYLSLNLRATDALTVRGGYDTRRSVRLYRNFVSPEIAFDDSFRTGIWAGVHGDLRGRGSLSLDGRRSTGGPVDTSATGRAASRTSDVYTATAALHEGGWLPVGLRGRTSLFRTPASSGWLQTFAVYGSPLPTLRLEATGGLRRDVPAPGTASAAITDRLTVRWLQLDADISLGRAWYLLLSLTSERGGWESSDQIYSALTYRF